MSALRVRDPLVASVATAELLTATIVVKLVILPGKAEAAVPNFRGFFSTNNNYFGECGSIH